MRAESLEKRGHRVHVPKVGNVAKHVLTVRQERRGQNGKRRILRAADRYFALELCPALNPDVVHARPLLPRDLTLGNNPPTKLTRTAFPR